MAYRLAKYLHITGLILWLGPSTGAFLLLLRARAAGGPWPWLLEAYGFFIDIEVFALVLLLGSGSFMRFCQPSLKFASWLKVKLYIVFLVLIPLEAAQFLFYGRAMKRASLLRPDEAFGVFMNFSLWAGPVFIVAVAAVFFLAIFRPVLKRTSRL